MLLLGFIASRTSIEAILFFTPGIVFVVVVGLLYFVDRSSGKETPRGRDVIASFWEEPEAAKDTESS
jgi:hypothetical protein